MIHSLTAFPFFFVFVHAGKEIVRFDHNKRKASAEEQKSQRINGVRVKRHRIAVLHVVCGVLVYH